MNTNFVFAPGRLTTLMDGGAGSSGKGRIGSYITEHASNFTFACNAFYPQAGHTIVLDDGSIFFYQTFNSCAYQERCERLLIGPGAIIELPAFFREIEESKIARRKIGLSPVVAVLQDKDSAFERGECDLDGVASHHTGTMLSGSTCHGVGAANARRLLRRKDVLLARDVPELSEFLCDVPSEIMQRLDYGESGFNECAQGFQLSLLHERFYPFCTSRNVLVSQSLSDLFIPPIYAGPVIINFRTYPIRINSRKFIGKDGRHLTWPEIEAGVPHRVIEGNSGHWYPDQQEITWEELTRRSGSPNLIMEITSVTKLPRRVATFSRRNLEEAIRHNRTGHPLYLSINFMDYVDHAVKGLRFSGDGDMPLTGKCRDWIEENISIYSGSLRFIGTGPKTDDTILVPYGSEGD